MRKDLKVSIISSIIAFTLIAAESYFNGELGSKLIQISVISIGCGFTAYLAMNSWFKESNGS